MLLAAPGPPQGYPHANSLGKKTCPGASMGVVTAKDKSSKVHSGKRSSCMTKGCLLPIVSYHDNCRVGLSGAEVEEEMRGNVAIRVGP